MTRVDREELRALLGALFGTKARILGETRGANDELVLRWAPEIEPGMPPLGAPPALVVEADGRTLRWNAPAPGYRSASFSIADLVEADPRRAENLDDRTRAVAAEVRALAAAGGLRGMSGGTALAVALNQVGLAPDAVAALVATACELDYWIVRREASKAWRYSLTEGDLALAPPFSREEAGAARRIAEDAQLQRKILDVGGQDDDGEIWLPILANPRAAPLNRGRTNEGDMPPL